MSEPQTWIPRRRPWGWADAIALALWTAAVLVMFRDAALLREAFFYFDITEINYPYRDFLAKEWREGRFSRWHPGLYCGMPLYSESQAGYLHPLKPLLYPWLPTWQAFNLDVVLSIWLTGLGTYGWLRRRVGPPGALTGAAIFGFGGYVWAHFVHTSMINALISLPWAVWALESSWESGRFRGSALGGLILTAQVFAGHLQDVLLTIMMLALYGGYRAAIDNGRRRFIMSSTGLLILLGVWLSAVQWIPSKELLNRSPRAEGLTWDEVTYGSWSPELLPTLIVREAYGTRARDTDWMDGYYPYHEMNCYLGMTALTLAILGCAAYRDRWGAFWILLSVISGLLMLGRFTFLFDIIHRLPVIGSSRIPVRYDLWLSLAVAALAAIGVDRLEQGGPIRLTKAAWTLTILIWCSVPLMLIIYAPVWTEPDRWSSSYHRDRFRWLGDELLWSIVRGALVTTLAWLAMIRATRAKSAIARRFCVWLLPIAVMADLLGSHWHDAPTIDPSYWTEPPPTAARLASDPNLQRVFGIAAKASSGQPGYASTAIHFPAQRDPLAWSLPPVWGLRSNIGETPIFPIRKKMFTDIAHKESWGLPLESVSHLITDARDDGERVGAATILRVRDPLPRVRWLDQAVYADGPAAAAAELRRIGDQVRVKLIVEDPDHPLKPAEDANASLNSGAAEIVGETPERVTIRVRSDRPGYVVISDAFDPGWSATLDGAAVPIRPAYLAFRAVFAEAGEHEIVMTYRPAGFAMGLAMTMTGAPLVLLLLLWPKRWAPPSVEHEDSGWPRRWPRILVGTAIAIVAVSTVGWRDGAPAIQSRWEHALHAFTWGAGVDAIGKVKVGR